MLAQRVELPARELTRLVVEQAIGSMLAARVRPGSDGKNADPYRVQKELYESVTRALYAKFAPEIGAALADHLTSPMFQSAASAAWLSDKVMMPVFVGLASTFARRIGAMDGDSPLFRFRVEPGPGAFGVVFVSASLFAVEEKRKATALAYAQLVSYAVHSVLTSKEFAASGVEAAHQLAGLIRLR